MFATQLWHHVKFKNVSQPLWSTSQLILCVASKSFSSLHNPEVWAYSACTAANLHTIIIDSSTTSHIHSNWAHFKSLKSSSSSINGFGDGSRSIQGHGKAQLYIACSPLIVYEFFCFKIKTKSRVDLYMPCKAIAHSTKLLSMRIPSTCEMYQGGIVGVCPLFQWV